MYILELKLTLRRGMKMNVNKYFTFGVAASLALIVSGCNNVSSTEVIAQSASTYEYSDMTCSELEVEMEYLSNAANSAGTVVDKKHSSVQGKNAAAFLFFWPALFLIDDNSVEAQQYAKLKGEYAAAKRVHRRKDC